MSNLRRLQGKLSATGVHGLLVPSTDEYLSEFAQPSARRLRWVTGFRGSTGMAIVLRDRAAMFLDGRYREQGERETTGLDIEVHDAGEAIWLKWLATHLSNGEAIAVDTRLHSYAQIERIRRFAGEHGFKMVEIDENPIDELWGSERPAALASTVIDYPVHFAGVSAEEKCKQLREHLIASGTDLHLLADPEDVAWLLNVRTRDSVHTTVGDWHVVPIPLTRAVLDAQGKVVWFIERSRLESSVAERLDEAVQIIDPAQFESFLAENSRGKTVGTNLQRTPHLVGAIVARAGTLKDDPIVTHRRWRKHPTEIERTREGHHQDGQAVIRFLAWLQRTVQERTVTELEAAQKLTDFRKELPGYQGMSMPLMSASGASGAMPHYFPSEQSNRRLNDHPIYWMDSGGQYYGCSTDNTVCIAVCNPEPRHVQAHTLVLKGYIALTRARFPVGVYSSQLDSLARQFLWQEGLDYRHGTGHGVGNFMNIHEGPSIRKEIHHPTVAPMEAGMIVSNEPGYYSYGDFGVRIESHLVTVPSRYDGFLEFELLSRLPIDPRLLDESLLTREERTWLAEYHAWIADGYKGCFDETTAMWLQSAVESYTHMAQRR